MSRGPDGPPGLARPPSPAPWKGLRTALAFLTAIPLHSPAPGDTADLRASVAWFPVAGVVIGLLASAACWAGDTLCGEPVGAALALAAGIVVTSGLHIDGLADTVDGLAGGWGDRARTMEIMRDSRIGALGAAAVVVCLVLRFAAISAAAAPARWLGVLAAPVAGRLSLVLVLSLFPYLHREGGAGAKFAGPTGRPQLAVAGATGLASILAAGGVGGLFSAGICLLAGLAVAHRIARALGGLTGDCYGAVCELTEVVYLLVWSALR